MRCRHPLIPKLWLMTDERMGDDLWDALKRLPRGSGVIFRHYGVA
ncbi:MAG: thiamine phosphate synthase, partial [Sphingomonadales bacterium]